MTCPSLVVLYKTIRVLHLLAILALSEMEYLVKLVPEISRNNILNYIKYSFTHDQITFHM